MGFIKDHWKIILVGLIPIFNGILGFLILLGITISNFLIIFGNFLISILYPFIQLWENVSNKKNITEVRIQGWEDPQEDFSQLRNDVNEMSVKIDKGKEEKEKKKEENRLLIDLINNNIISKKTLEKNILDKKFISVLCYQAGFNVRSGIVSKELKRKIDEIVDGGRGKERLAELGIDVSREYESIFKELGFIKLAGNSPFYIIPEENIYPKELRDLDQISNHFIKNGYLVVDREWKKIKEVHKKHDKEYYEKIKDIANPVNLNMLIMKIDRKDMRNKFILRNDFNKEFSNELSTIVKLEKFKTESSEKIDIKTIVSQSSLKILILSVNESDRNKILELEEIFKKDVDEGGLGIDNFYDYYTKDKKNIENILKTKFRDKKSKRYAELIWDNSRDYKKDLLELGIKI